MDNTARRVNYLGQRRPELEPAVTVRRAYREGTPDSALFTPAQRRRLKHKSGSGEHVRVREQLRRQDIRANRAARWDVLTPRPPERQHPARTAPRRPEKTAADEQRLLRAVSRRQSRAARMLALVRRRAGVS